MQTASSRSVIAQCHCQWLTAKCRRGLHIIAHKPTAIHKVLLTALQKRHAELPRRSSWLAHKPPWFRVGWNKVQPSLLDHCPNRGGHSETRQTTAAAATHVSAADSHPTSPHLAASKLWDPATPLWLALPRQPPQTQPLPRASANPSLTVLRLWQPWLQHAWLQGTAAARALLAACRAAATCDRAF